VGRTFGQFLFQSSAEFLKLCSAEHLLYVILFKVVRGTET